MNKDIFIRSLDKTINFLKENSQNKTVKSLEGWREKLLEANSDDLINEFVSENFYYMIESNAVNEDMVIDNKNKTVHDNLPDEDQKLKDLEEKLEENENMLSFIILNNIVLKENKNEFI